MTVTNVRVPEAALRALALIRADRGYPSQSETVRQLINEYVEAQRGCEPRERLTHLATVLRYPPPRKEARLTGQSPGKQLRVSVDNDTWAAARSLAFQLPGQSANRGHGQYQARLGTDVILTAIARVEPLDDPILGTTQLLTHHQARGLWRLVVESTLTDSEMQVREFAASAVEQRDVEIANGTIPSSKPSYSEGVALQLDEIVWHSPARFKQAAIIVARRLHLGDSDEFLRILHEQDHIDEDRWLDEVDKCRRLSFNPYSNESKGASAVRRAERAAATAAMVEWIAESVHTSTPLTFEVLTPGWGLQLPPDWTPIMFPAGEVPSDWVAHVDGGRVLHLHHGDTAVLWPCLIADDGTATLVPGFDAVIDGAAVDKHPAIAEAVLWDLADGDEDGGALNVPAHVAHHLGLIDESRRDEILAAARTAELEAAAVKSESWERPHLSHDLLFDDLEVRLGSERDRHRARMAYARGHQAMLRYLSEIDHPVRSTGWFSHRHHAPRWAWRATSIAAAIADGTIEASAARWLTSYAVEAQRLLVQKDAHERWIKAIEYQEQYEHGCDAGGEDDDDRSEPGRRSKPLPF